MFLRSIPKCYSKDFRRIVHFEDRLVGFSFMRISYEGRQSLKALEDN